MMTRIKDTISRLLKKSKGPFQESKLPIFFPATVTYDSETDIIRFPKEELGHISDHFLFKEFACKCSYPSCKEQIIKKELIDKLEETRKATGLAIIVTSAYRCSEYQEELRERGFETSKGPSTHSLGMAVDIKQSNMNTLLGECSKRFLAIGVARSFLHVDLRKDKKRRWTYA